MSSMYEISDQYGDVYCTVRTAQEVRQWAESWYSYRLARAMPVVLLYVRKGKIRTKIEPLKVKVGFAL